jgi:GTP cyclohydrolase I
MQEHLGPKGIGVYINARHFCIETRGVRHMDSTTITTALKGVMLTKDAARNEFLSLARE